MPTTKRPCRESWHVLRVRVTRIVLCQCWGNRGNKSVLLKMIEVVFGRNGLAREVIKQHFKILIGDGNNTNFCSDDWTERGQLRHSFPRIYALASSKSDPVASFGRYGK